MEGYKYVTKISKKGKIQLSINPLLYDKEVEILIFPKDKTEEKVVSASNFVNKWAGFLKEKDPDQAKLDYLQEKYK